MQKPTANNKTNYQFGKQTKSNAQEIKQKQTNYFTNTQMQAAQLGLQKAKGKGQIQPPNDKQRSAIISLLKTSQRKGQAKDDQIPIPRNSYNIMSKIKNPNQKDQKNTPEQKLHLQKENELKLIIKVQSAFRRQRIRKVFLVKLKQFKYRRSVIAELIKTEETYVADLDIIIIQVFSIMLKDKIINDDQHKILSSNIKELRKLNGEFLTQIKMCFVKNGIGPYVKIGEVLQQYVPFFKIYYQYYNDFKQSQALIQTLKQQKEFVAFVKHMQNSKDFRYLDLESFLVKPIQRLPKYVLLLTDLVKHTDKTHPDFQKLEESLKLYKEVTEANNMHLNRVLQNSKLFELQKLFPESRIVDANRNYIQEEYLQMFWKDKIKAVLVHFCSDLILITVRKVDEGQLKLCGLINLNSESVVKDIPDSQYFQNLITVIGENDSVTFIEVNEEAKKTRISQIESILDVIKLKSESRQVAINKNLTQQVEKKTYQIQVSVLGTEQRQSNPFTTFTVYIIEVSISDIAQNIYLRFSELMSLQNLIKKQFPRLQISYMHERTWHSGNSAKEVEARTLQIISFLSTLMQSSEFRSNKSNSKVLTQLGLPENFYMLPELLINQEASMQNGEFESNIDLSQSLQRNFSQKDLGLLYRSSNELDHKDSKDVKDVRNSTDSQDLGKSISRDTKLGTRAVFGTKYSASKLIRSAGQSLEKHQQFLSPERNSGKQDKNDKKIITVQITINSFHQSKSKIQAQVGPETQLMDLYDLMIKELGLIDAFDFKFLIPDNDKAKTLRVIKEDEILINIFSSTSLFDKLLRDNTEVHFRKYLYLDIEQEEQQYTFDKVKLNLTYRQFLYQVKNNFYTLSIKDYYFLVACHFFISGVTIGHKFPYDSLNEIIPSAILKTTKKELWSSYIVETHKKLVDSISQESTILEEAHYLAQKVFINSMYQNILCGKQIFQVSPAKEAMDLLKIPDQQLHLGVGVQGISVFESKKKTIIKQFDYLNLKSIKAHAASLVIADIFCKKYIFNCSNGIHIQQLVEEYQQVIFQLNEQEKERPGEFNIPEDN